MTTLTPFSPVPTRKDPDNFDDRADNFLGELENFAVEMNLVIGEMNAASSAAVSAASTAAGAATQAAASANFKGNWSSLTGAVSRPASVYHSSKYWMLLPASLANITLSQPGVSADWVEIKTYLTYYTYANRNNVRSLVPTANDQLVIEGLGLFVWNSGSTEIDDDETCFATASGRWLLEAASPDFLYGLADQIESDSLDTIRYEFSRRPTITKKVTTSGITSIATVTQSSFVVTMEGARVGDTVIVNPPNALTFQVSVHAYVSAVDTITVCLNNPSATTATLTDGNWVITLIKGI